MTSKQQAVAKDLLENTGKSISRAMLDAGYAPSSAKNPQQLTNSKNWQKLMREYLPDENLIEKHQALLGVSKLNKIEFPEYIDEKVIKNVAKKIPGFQLIGFGRKPNGTILAYYSVPDYEKQLLSLNLAYRLKGKLNPNVSVSGEKVIAILNGASDDSSKADNP